METWRFLQITLLLTLIKLAASDSDPFENFQNAQFDVRFRDYEHAPGEPLNPLDFQNAENLTVSSQSNGEKGDPIEIAGLYEGDIIIPSMNMNTRKKPGLGGLNAIKHEGQKWNDGIVPYLISSQFDEKERSHIARAILEFHRQTCIVFQPRKNENDYVHIAKGQGCSSPVGRQGGPQQVTLGHGCVYPGIAIHELMHAVGFWHEQSRWDRDEYVTIYFQNIKTGMEFNFQKYSWGDIQNLSAPYDTGSIMHYGPYAFSKDRKLPTILPKNPNDKIGQRYNFSEIDAFKINKLYNCKVNSNSDSDNQAQGSLGSRPPPPVANTTPSSVNEKCTDSHKHCQRWSEMGECSRNPTWMNANCKKACNQCDTPCSDSNKNCKTWEKGGECSKNPNYMHTYCAKSCQKCGSSSSEPSGNRCEDKDKHCASWASRGECDRNPKYMLSMCAKSCNSCKAYTKKP